MLILTRKRHESVRIGRETQVTVLEVRGNTVKLGFRSPREVPIHREEVYQRLDEAEFAHADMAGSWAR